MEAVGTRKQNTAIAQPNPDLPQTLPELVRELQDRILNVREEDSDSDRTSAYRYVLDAVMNIIVATQTNKTV